MSDVTRILLPAYCVTKKMTKAEKWCVGFTAMPADDHRDRAYDKIWWHRLYERMFLLWAIIRFRVKNI